MRQLLAFISYSQADGRPFATRLRDCLRSISPPVEPWIDLDHPRGYDFPPEIRKAIGGCDVLLFVLTRDSIQSPWCRREVGYADQIGKRVLVLQENGEVDPLDILELYGRPPINFTEWAGGWSELHRELVLIDAPEARIASLEAQRDIFTRRARNARGPARSRNLQMVSEIEARIEEERRRQEHLGRAAVSGPGPGSAEEPRDADATVKHLDSGIYIVGEPPPPFPDLFLDRITETQRLKDCLQDPSIRLVAIVGRAGIGKTAMLSRLLKDLRAGTGHLPVDAFLYLPADGSQPLGPAMVLDELSKVVTDYESGALLGEHLNDSRLALADKLDLTLEQLARRHVVVAIDSAEELLDRGRRVRDHELDEMFRKILLQRGHGVKLVLSTRTAPEQLLSDLPNSAARLQVDKGLPAPDAVRFLRSTDPEAIYELGSAPDEPLEEAHRYTDGNPRALELVFSLLKSDPELSLAQLLDEMNQIPEDEDVLSHLVGRLFDRLDAVDRRVMQALAIYGRPVLPAAVDYLLRWYLPGYESESALRRLLDRRLVRQDDSRFFVPRSPDGQRLLDGIPLGQPDDRDRDPPPITQLAMFHLAAGYFASQRRHRVKRIGDLGAWFADIDLRIRGQDYRTALNLISTIDQDHLIGWGQSHAVAAWREELCGKLGDKALEMHNYSMLAYARRLQEDLDGSMDLLERAVKLAKELGNKQDLVRLRNELGSVLFDNGEVTRAMQAYESGRRTARKLRMPLEEAKAHDGLMLCNAEMGRFRQALEHHSAARDALKDLRDEESEVLRIELLLNVAWIHAQLGQNVEALDRVNEGRKLADEMGEELLEGLLLNCEALVLIDGHPAQAIKPASQAVAIGSMTRNPNLSRDANTSLALAHLCTGNEEAAAEAADAAAKHRSRRALGAFAVQGITAYRRGDLEKARLAFQDAHLQAAMLRGRERQNYQVFDLDGLALCGLALCDHDAELFGEAAGAYRAARAIAPEDGVVRRALILLDELGRDADELRALRRAASGG